MTSYGLGFFGQQARDAHKMASLTSRSITTPEALPATANTPSTPAVKKKGGRKTHAKKFDDDDKATPTPKPKRKYVRKQPVLKPGDEGYQPKAPRKKREPKPKPAKPTTESSISLSGLLAQGGDIPPPASDPIGASDVLTYGEARTNAAATSLPAVENTAYPATTPSRKRPHCETGGEAATARPSKRARRFADDTYSALPDIPSEVPPEHLAEAHTVQTAPPYPYDEAHPDIAIPQVMSRRQAEEMYRGGEEMPPLGRIEGEEGWLEDPRFFDGETAASSSSSDESEGEVELMDVNKEEIIAEIGVGGGTGSGFGRDLSLRELKDHAAFFADVREAFLRYRMERWYAGIELESKREDEEVVQVE